MVYYLRDISDVDSIMVSQVVSVVSMSPGNPDACRVQRGSAHTFGWAEMSFINFNNQTLIQWPVLK